MNNITDLRKKGKADKFDVIEWLSLSLSVVGAEKTNVYIVDLPEHLNSKDVKFYGITEKLEIPNTYRLYLLAKETQATQKDVLCHESVHIKQYEDGRLAIKDKTTLIFEGKEYNPPYSIRQPHEREAFDRQGEIKREVKKLLKLKNQGNELI